MRTDSFATYYKAKAASAAVDDKDWTVPAGKSFNIVAVDFTAPAQQMAGVRLRIDGNDISVAQGDKYVLFPVAISVEAGQTVTIRLDNSNNLNAALLGATIYYEE